MSLDFKDQTVLIPGGCGFIGSNLVSRLLQENVEHCYVLDDLFTGDEEFLPKSDRVTFVKGSVTDQELLDELVPKADYIINCATVNIMAAQENSMNDLLVNSGGNLQLLETAKRVGRLKKFVYTSSASVYGNPDALPILETARYKPMSYYAVSKLAGENYTHVFFLLYDLPTTVVRYSNVFGSNQSAKNPYCGVIGKFINSALEKGEVNIYGSGLQTRDFTYVDDAVEATLMAALQPKAEGRIFNVSSGYETSIRELVAKIFSILEKDPKINFIQKRDIDNISRRCLNIEALRSTLKWEPLFDLESGLRETIAWYKASRAN